MLEGASFASYVVMFGPIFCTGLGWRRSWQIGGAELAMGSLVPASGAGGLALGAWILHRGGMDGVRIARRSVAFFLIKSGVNFLAVAVIGAVMAIGLVGPELSLWLTAVPAAVAALAIGAVAALPRLGPGRPAGLEDSRLRRGVSAARRAVITGSAEAAQILRSGNRRVLAGALGYWAFDNAVLWATYHAFDISLPLTILLMGYLIGQLGGLLPIPGGIGGIDGGLIGTLIVYGSACRGHRGGGVRLPRDPLLAAAGRRRRRLCRLAPRHAGRLRARRVQLRDRRPNRLTTSAAGRGGGP